MRRLVLALCLLVSGATASDAAPKLNVLVMGQDAEAAASTGESVVVARDTRIFNRVRETVAHQLIEGGFDVYDERLLVRDKVASSRAAAGEADLMTVARSIQRPAIDAAVIFTVYAGARHLTYTTEISTRIAAQIVNVRTGKRLGSLEVTSPKGWRAPVGCENDCLVEAIGKSAQMMAADLGTQLARALASDREIVRAAVVAAPLPRKQDDGYTLVFAGFAAQEIADAESYLVAFKGYREHRRVSDAAQGRSTYWYATEGGTTAISHDLRMMLDRLGTVGDIDYATSKRTFTIRRAAPGIAH